MTIPAFTPYEPHPEDVAARAVDIAVAKALGWQVFSRPSIVKGLPPVWVSISPQGFCVGTHDEEQAWNNVPRFSRDKSCLAEMLGWASKQDLGPSICDQGSALTNPANKWICSLGFHPREVRADGASPQQALANAIAALAPEAKGGAV